MWRMDLKALLPVFVCVRDSTGCLFQGRVVRDPNSSELLDVKRHILRGLARASSFDVI